MIGAAGGEGGDIIPSFLPGANKGGEHGKISGYGSFGIGPISKGYVDDPRSSYIGPLYNQLEFSYSFLV